MTDIEQAKKWCDEARKILNSGSLFKFDRSRMYKRSAEVHRLLTEMEGQHEYLADEDYRRQHERFAGRYETLAKAAKATTDRQDLKTRDKARLVLEISKKLSILKNEIRLMRSEVHEHLTPKEQRAREQVQEKLDQKRSAAESAAQKRLQTYEARLAATRKLEIELKALSREGKDYAQPVTELVEAAVILASEDPPRHIEALAKLEEAKQAFMTQNKRAAVARRRRVAGAQYRPLYELAQQRTKEAIAELKLRPGTHDHRIELEQRISRGDEVVTESGDYKAALGGFRGLEKTVQAAHRASAKFIASAGGPEFQESRKRAETALATYTKVAGAGDPEWIAERRQKIDRLIKAHEGEPQRADVEQAKNEMRTLAEELAQKVQDLETNQESCKELVTKVEKLVEETGRMAKPAEFAPHQASFRAAMVKYGTNLFSKAITDLNALETKVTNLRNQVAGDYDLWEKANDSYRSEYLPELKKVLPNMVPPAQAAASRLERMYTAVQKEVQTTHEYGAAARKIEEVNKSVKDEIAPMVQKYRLLDDRRNESREFEKNQSTRIDAKIAELASQGGDVASFEERRNKALGAAFNERKVAMESASLAAVDKELRQAFDGIVTDIDAILQDSNRLEASVGAAKLSKQKVEFEKLAGVVEERIDYLRVGDYSAGDTFANELKTLREADFGDESLQSMQTLQTNIEEKIEKQKGESSDRAKALRTEIKSIEAQLAKLKKQRPKYKKMLQDLDEEMDICRTTADSTVPAVLDSCKTAIDELSARLQELAPSNSNFEKIDRGLKEIRDELHLDHPHLKEHCASHHQALLTRLESQIEPDLWQRTPLRGWKDILKPFLATVDEAVQRAGQANAIRLEITRLADRARADLGKLEGARILAENLGQRIEAAAKPSEAREEQARQELESIIALIIALTDDPEARLQAERGARDAKLEAEMAAPAFKAELTIFEKTLLTAAEKAYKELSRGERNKVLRKRMRDTYHEAENVAKKSRFAVARDKLAEAGRLARDLAANPRHAQGTARKNLGKVNDKWNRAVLNFVTKVNALAQEIRVATETEDPDTGKAAVALLKKLTLTFDPKRFDKAIVALTGGKLKTPEHRATKETALRMLRHYQRRIKNDPVIDHLTTSPFKTNVPVTDLIDRMTDLELNLRRA